MEITEYHPFKSNEKKEKYLKFYNKRAEKWPVSSENIMVDTSYGKTFVRISGPEGAKPLLMLPGGASSSLMWIPNIEALSQEYRTYSVDNIYDYGRSVYSKKINNSKDFVNWLNELFDALELGNDINLMGLSFGGWIVSQYALQSSERLNKVVLLAPVATVQSIPLKSLMVLFASALPFDFTTRAMIRWAYKDSLKDEENRTIIDEWLEEMLMGSKCFKFKLFPTPTVLEDEELKSIKVPMLFLVGENDKIYSPEKVIKRLNSLVPHIETEILPNAGHDLTVAQKEMVNEKVMDFLKK